MLTPSEIAAIGAAMALSGAKAEDACVQALVSLATSGALDGASLADALGMSFQVPGLVIGTLRDTPIVSSQQLVSVVSDALGRSARRDAKALGVTPEALERALTPGHDAVSGTQAVVESLRAAFARDNLAMASDARDTWSEAVSEWVPKAARGEVAYETAVAGIAKECADRGVKAVDYRSGRRDSPDVAARRHVVTQIQQAAASRTADAASKMGDGLVFVSSHIGARPSHREWQGRPYAMHGPKTIDGVTYPDLAEATGYGTPGGLCGANCRHSFGPWMHWQTRPYSPTPDEDAGLDPDEAYRATQKQRANERAIRKAKLEAQAAKAAGLDDTEARLRLGRAQKAQRDLMSQNKWLTRRPERETAYGADGKPVSVTPLTRPRLTKESVLDANEEVYRSAGVSRARVGRALSAAGLDLRTATPSDAAAAVRNVVRGIRRDEDSVEAHRLIISGTYPLSVRRAKQEEHILGTEARARRMAKAKDGEHGPSIVNMSVEEVQDLVNECSGHGLAHMVRHKNGGVELSEKCMHPNGDIIGIYVNENLGVVTETDTFVIHYSKKRGTHIVPSAPTWMEKG